MEIKKLPKVALEELIKKNFCYSENSKAIMGCSYITEKFCPKTCEYCRRILLKDEKGNDLCD